MIAFYYGLTGIVCVVYYRRYLLTSWRNFVFVGLMPGIGGTVLALIFVKSLVDNFKDKESYGVPARCGLGVHHRRDAAGDRRAADDGVRPSVPGLLPDPA